MYTRNDLVKNGWQVQGISLFVTVCRLFQLRFTEKKDVPSFDAWLCFLKQSFLMQMFL